MKLKPFLLIFGLMVTLLLSLSGCASPMESWSHPKDKTEKDYNEDSSACLDEWIMMDHGTESEYPIEKDTAGVLGVMSANAYIDPSFMSDCMMSKGWEFRSKTE